MSTALPYSEFSKVSVEDLVSIHAELVKRIAYHMAARMPANVEVDDLIQAGMLGLLEAARNYSSDKGASFETFAGIRIRGAILDDVRRLDWAPRSVRHDVRKLAECVRQIEHRTGSAATPGQVASEMGIELDDYFKLTREALTCRMFSLDDFEDGAQENSLPSLQVTGDELPDSMAEQDEFRNAMAEAISGLPEREKLVMSLYYEEELNLREIGDVLEISESRVCQIHGQALVRLRARLDNWNSGQ